MRGLPFCQMQKRKEKFVKFELTGLNMLRECDIVYTILRNDL